MKITISQYKTFPFLGKQGNTICLFNSIKSGTILYSTHGQYPIYRTDLQVSKWKMCKEQITLSNSPSNTTTIDKNICPRCGKRMKWKVAKRGKSIGHQFLGCSGFPKCRFTIN
jgi:restriction system protein